MVFWYGILKPKIRFVPIHNDYGYVTLDVENGKLIKSTIPNKPRMD